LAALGFGWIVWMYFERGWVTRAFFFALSSIGLFTFFGRYVHDDAQSRWVMVLIVPELLFTLVFILWARARIDAGLRSLLILDSTRLFEHLRYIFETHPIARPTYATLASETEVWDLRTRITSGHLRGHLSVPVLPTERRRLVLPAAHEA
jgi:hypothetical protein